MGIDKKRVSIFLFLFFAATLFGAGAVHAQYEARDVVGQSGGTSQFFTYASQDNSPNSEGLHSPRGMALDTVNHRLFLSDSGNNRVLIFNLDSTNQLLDHSADFVLGQPDFKSSTATTTQSGMKSPFGLAYDEQNNRLFVADEGNGIYGRVLIFDVSTVSNGMNASYILGRPDFTNTDTLVPNATSTNGPTSVAYDSVNGRLFVSDAVGSMNRILVFDVATSTISSGEAASHVLGAPNLNVGGTVAASTSTVDNPWGLSYDSVNSRLFVVDYSNSRILIFNAATSTMTDGEDASYVLGKPDFTSSATGSFTSSTLTYPQGAFYSASKDWLFVADGQAHRAVIFDVSSSTMANGKPAMHVLGQPDFVSGSASTTQALFNTASDILYDEANQRIWVGDYLNNRVMIFDATTIIDGENAVDEIGQLNVGSLYWTTSGADNTPNEKGFYLPTDAAIDTVHHRLFTADQGNNRILVFNLSTDNELLDKSADFVIGGPDFKTNNIYLSQNGLNVPTAIAYDPVDDRLFVSELNNSRVTVFDTASLGNGMNASYVLGAPDFITSGGGTSSSTFWYVNGLAYDEANSRLFVSDGGSGGNNRVLVFNVATSTIFNGEPASNVLGQTDFISSAAATTQNGMDMPMGLLYDGDNNLFVADSNNARVLKFDVTPAALADGENASAVLGQADFTSKSVGTTSSTLHLARTVVSCGRFCNTTITPGGNLTYDSRNKLLFVSDTYNNRVMVFRVSHVVDGQSAIGVLGQSNFTSSAAGVGKTSLDTPLGLTYNPSTRNVLVTDSNNNRILDFSFVRIVTSDLPAATVGVSYAQPINTTSTQGTVSYSLDSGSLPPGMALGSVDGTPTDPGTYTFTVAVSDTVGGVGYFLDTKTYTLVVSAPPGPEPSHGGQTFAELYPGVHYGAVSNPAPTSTVPAATSTGITTSTPPQPLICNYFIRSLRYLDRSAEVKKVQEFLRGQKLFTYPTTTNFFGPVTFAAVKKFQAAHKAEILTPNRLMNPTGFWGPSTIAFANTLTDCP